MCCWMGLSNRLLPLIDVVMRPSFQRTPKLPFTRVNESVKPWKAEVSTSLQKACGFDDSPEEMFRYLVASSGPGPDEAKIRLFCEHSVEHFHWLVERGVPFRESYYAEGTDPPTDDCLTYTGSELAHPYCHLAKPAPRGHTVQQEGVAGGRLMQCLLAATGRAGFARWQ